jgi:hypothetical protein
MHRKKVFALAGVFLAVALVSTPVILLLQADSDLDNLIITQNPKSQATGGNVTYLTPEEIQENNTNALILVVVIDVIFITLFVVTLFYGIKHAHPEH